ncbi:hypothetical protein TSIB_1978 [Thermococcus sibiricus MM 739]|uniref:Uncharacterized protein n=1 Tax=Thermococcus sibiricus (strain DSM 12597 / MM 739) TaxID=604354 RepID=C6A046_THESM|nr:hypothetical protein TSIB_1978 [Thermococcus sibiricus MM 739]
MITEGYLRRKLEITLNPEKSKNERQVSRLLGGEAKLQGSPTSGYSQTTKILKASVP